MKGRVEMENIKIDDVVKEIREHGERVAELARSLSTLLGITSEDQGKIAAASLLHDVGKVALDIDVLYKVDNLTDAERKHVQEHAVLGAFFSMLKDFDPFIVNAILYHHENYDGSGYPGGLRGEEIPLASRIIRVCDVFDAMTFDRPYRKKMNEDEAIEVMKKEQMYYDPEIFTCFCYNIYKIIKMEKT